MSAELSLAPFGYLVNRKSHTHIPLHEETPLGRDAGLQIDGISRRHCIIKYEDGFFISDSNSRYGTFINRQRIAPNQWRSIKPGDSITLGGFELQLIEAKASRATREMPLPKEKPAAVKGEHLVQHLHAAPAPAPAPTPVAEAEPMREVNDEQTKTNAPEGAGEELATLATVPTRLAAVFIDTLLYMTISFIMVTFAGRASWVEPSAYLLGMIFVTFGPWILKGQSLGKMAMKIKVVNEDGTDLPVPRMFLRDLALKHGLTFAGALLVFLMPPLAIGLFLVAPALMVWHYNTHGLIFWDFFGKTRVIDV